MSTVDFDKLLSGERRALAKAITLVESSLPRHRSEAQTLLEAALPHSGNSVRIGISGVPGVGKSTFIEAFGYCLLDAGKRVAVLAVDPSSPRGGGSIMGDKTRMEHLAREADVFIRPSPAGETLGGVAQKTRECILLCEAAGYDAILVETVGVGQSEHQVSAMVDFFMLLMLPGGGDELQGIKKGIVELAHAIVINKADGEGEPIAKRTQTQYQSALGILASDDAWKTQVLLCSAQEKRGIDAVWEMIGEFVTQGRESGSFERRRAHQSSDWMRQLVRELLLARFSDSAAVSAELPQLEAAVQEQRNTPYAAAQRLLSLLDGES